MTIWGYVVFTVIVCLLGCVAVITSNWLADKGQRAIDVAKVNERRAWWNALSREEKRN